MLDIARCPWPAICLCMGVTFTRNHNCLPIADPTTLCCRSSKLSCWQDVISTPSALRAASPTHSSRRQCPAQQETGRTCLAHIGQDLHDAARDVRNMLLACKAWSSIADSICYTITHTVPEGSPGGSLASDAAGIRWLSKHSGQIRRLALWNESGPACYVLRGLPWPKLQDLEVGMLRWSCNSVTVCSRMSSSGM